MTVRSWLRNQIFYSTIISMIFTGQDCLKLIFIKQTKKKWKQIIANPGTMFTFSLEREQLKVSSNPGVQLSSVQFSRSVVSNCLQPHESQHAGPPCPSPIPGVHPNPRSSSWVCHPTISSSVVPFSSCPQSFPASGSFQMSPQLTLIENLL